jgi:hypothetical protein
MITSFSVILQLAGEKVGQVKVICDSAAEERSFNGVIAGQGVEPEVLAVSQGIVLQGAANVAALVRHVKVRKTACLAASLYKEVEVV